MKAVFHMQDGKIHTIIFNAFHGLDDTVKAVGDAMRKPNSIITLGTMIVNANHISTVEILDA